MQCGDRVTQGLRRDECLDREGDNRLAAVLREAMEAVAWAWTILAAEIQRFGCAAERPVPEEGDLYSYFDTVKWDVLEMSDSIYCSLSSAEREKDDRDLEEFEATLFLREEYSPRIKALAFLTAGKLAISSMADTLSYDLDEDRKGNSKAENVRSF